MDDEIWKPIPGFPDYEVSDKGGVRSFKRGNVRILKTPPDDKGYRQVLLSNNNHQVHKRVHNLVMLAFVGPCPEGMEVCHNDGNPGCNSLDNLRYDTHTANANDSVAHGRKGDFTLEQVKQLRLKGQVGYLPAELAKELNSNRSIIYRVMANGYALAGPPPVRVREFGRERARKIRIEYAAGNITLLELAKKYDLAESAVSHIVRGARHKDAGGPIKGIDYQ